MPHLVYCGRLWRFSSDELSIPSICAAVWRIIWCGILCAIFSLANVSLKGCAQGWIILIYLGFSIFVSLSSVICELCLAKISLKGTIVDYEPRINILFFMTLHIVFVVCQLICAIFGIYVVNYNSLPCVDEFRDTTTNLLLYITIITQLIDIFGLLCCWTIFSSRRVTDDEPDFRRDIHLTRQSSFTITGQYSYEEANSKWSTRCKFLCKGIQCCTCNLIGGSGVQDDLDAVGAVLSDFFHHEGFLDVVPSDVVAGIILLRFQQHAKLKLQREEQIDYLKQKLISRYVSTPRSPPDSIPGRSYFKYPPQVAEAVETVARTLNAEAPEDTDTREFMTRTKTQYLTALEILNQENFNIDLPSLSSDADELSSFSVSVDCENESNMQSVMSNVKNLLTAQSGVSNKSLGSISSKDLGSKNPSMNSVRYFDEDYEKRITPRGNRTPSPSPGGGAGGGGGGGTVASGGGASVGNSSEGVRSVEMTTTPRTLTPRLGIIVSDSVKELSPTPLTMERRESIDEEVSLGLSDMEAELGDEFDENGINLTLNEPFDPRVNKADLKHSIATNFSEIEELAHFAQYALGIYSTLMYLYMNPCCGMCKLCHFCSCSHPMGHCNPLLQCCEPTKLDTNGSTTGCDATHSEVVGDNMCHFHEAAIRKMSHLDSAELIYAQLSNAINETPYAVFVDYKRAAVVITVRGTLSLEDCITDAMAHPESLTEAGKEWSFVGERRYAHSGMLRSAIQIRKSLRKIPCVNELLNYVAGEHPTGGDVYRGMAHSFCANMVTPSYDPTHIYRLYIVGHSLGAGVAAILGLLMKSEFPTLKVLVYGTPGSVFDKRTAGDVSLYTTSCVLGNDLVATLSFHSLSYLRENVLESISRCKVGKMTIMQSALFNADPDLDALLHPKGFEPDSKFHTMVHKYKAHMRKKLKSRRNVRLYHPGKIIHLRHVGADSFFDKCCPDPFRKKNRMYAPFVTNMYNFLEIMISPSMVLDHLPDNYVKHLDRLVEEWAAERRARGSTASLSAATNV